VKKIIKSFPGTLFLVVGNSGSGKDSMISGVVQRYPKNLKEIFVPKRFITRKASEFEDNIYITPKKFREMEEQGKFALKWHIYGLDYGVSVEIDEWLKKGHPVIVNVSRMIIEEARDTYEKRMVVFIEVPFELTMNRIKDRGRENEEGLKKRIERAKTHQNLPEADFVVNNSGRLDDAIEQFLHIVMKVVEKNK